MSDKDKDDNYVAINEKEDKETEKPNDQEGYERANDCLPCGKLCGKE